MLFDINQKTVLHIHFMTYLCIYMNQQYISLLYTLRKETKLIAKLSWDLCSATDYEFQNILIPTKYMVVCCLRIVSFGSLVCIMILYIKQEHIDIQPGYIAVYYRREMKSIVSRFTE